LQRKYHQETIHKKFPEYTEQKLEPAIIQHISNEFVKQGATERERKRERARELRDDKPN
jgi:predicted metal-dependent RNase